jgi:hypothetical protein
MSRQLQTNNFVLAQGAQKLPDVKFLKYISVKSPFTKESGEKSVQRFWGLEILQILEHFCRFLLLLLLFRPVNMLFIAF